MDFSSEGSALADLNTQLSVHGIPHYMRDGIVRYILHGIRPGLFLFSILSNDLVGAVSHADGVNAAHLLNYARFLSALPRSTWGNAASVEWWIDHGGITGGATDIPF